jgi:hypothetical protein
MPKLFAESITESMSVKEGSFNINTSMVLMNCALACRMRHAQLIDTVGNATQPHAKYVFKYPIPFREKGAEKTVNSKLTFTFNN